MELSIASWGLLARLARSLNPTISREGLHGGTKSLLKRYGVALQTIYDDPTIEETMLTTPLIVVANHPSESDPIMLLASMPARKDIYLVANSFLLGIAPALDRYLLPVYIDYRIHQKNNDGAFKLDLLKRIHKIACYSREIEHQKNVETIQKATTNVNQGHAVVIFPGAGGGKRGKWFSGVGYLLKKVTHKNAVIVMAYIDCTSDKDYLRIIPGVSRLLKNPKVYYSKLMEANVYKGKEGKEIAEDLEKQYWEWVNKSTWHHQN